jgi:cytochrome c-type biogenesis protein CcmH/NrfG
MKIKNLWTAFVGCALVALSTMSVFAQVGRIEGSVVKKGTTEPIVGAEVQIARTDIKGNYDIKTDKKGNFLHAGVPYVGTYTIIISAPGFAPYFMTSIRPTGELLKVELEAGDGRKLTLEDVKKIQGSPAGGGAQKQMSAAEMKKAQEEYDKKKAEIESQNKKNKEDFENMKKYFDQGQQMAANKDYNGAVTAYNEAAKIDPEQQAIWANLALALYNRGVTNLNDSLKDPSKRDPAKQDFNDSVSAIGKALTLVETQLADPAKGAQAKKSKSQYLKIKADSESLLARRLGVAEMATAAVKDYKEAGDLSDNPADKKSYELKGAETLFDSGKAEEAVAAYQAILTSDPENIEALYKLGLAYASVAKFQDSANTLQKFLDKAPETDSRVPEVKAVIKDLVVGNNLQPPKSEPTRGRAPAKRKP